MDWVRKCAGPCGLELPETKRYFEPLSSRKCRWCLTGKKIVRMHRPAPLRVINGVEEQKCKKCNLWKPRNFDTFRYAPQNPHMQRGGFRHTCRSCEAAARKVVRRACKTCGVSKPVTKEFFYSRNSRGYILFDRDCIPCAKIRMKAYYRSPKSKRQRKRYRESGRLKEIYAKRQNRPKRVQYADRPLEKLWRNKIARLVRKGRIIKPEKCRCGRVGVLSARFMGDYHELDKLDWLCYICLAIPRVTARRREERLEAVGDAESDPMAAMAVDPAEWRAIHEKHKAEHRRQETAWGAARASLDTSNTKLVLARKRLAFLIFGCGYNSSEAKDIMSREGWDGHAAPLEPVLGHWVPT